MLETMNLISQNVAPKDRTGKKKREPLDECSPLEGKEQNEDMQISDLDTTGGKKRKKHRKELEAEEVREMKRLETFLFGSLHSPIEFGKVDEKPTTTEEAEKDSAVFFVDRHANSSLTAYEDDNQVFDGRSDEQEAEERKPAWIDEEEEKTSINVAKVNRLRKLRKEEDESVISGSAYVARLRAQHVKLNPGTEWARTDSQRESYISDGEDSGSDEENGYKDAKVVGDILRTNEQLVVKSSAKLLPGMLEYSRLADANKGEYSSGPINSVQFHRNSQLLLVGGLDKKLRFFQIDGKDNTKIQSIFIEDCPIKKAAFSPDGSQVIISGRRKFFYALDLVKTTLNKIGPLAGREERSLESFEVSPDSDMIAFIGNEGYILLVSLKTKELVGTLKMNGTIRSLAFSHDGQKLLSSGGDGQIYHWDLRRRACFHKGVDEGCINGTALCTSPIGGLFAAGSDSGIVNIYNTQDFLGGKRKPVKTIENLTTKVDYMKFNSDAQILAIGSTMKKNSSKLIHIPSFTVFSNWPPPNQTLHYPRCLDFSPHSGFMAMGNASGKVLLYKLHHYHHA
ncbi:PREDICTED: U3 small nucleolar RNA-associated protein 18 homolog [Ipomoea nil]|uniref:U3 small nucleolar RNA-associated protein 18 homolog n=1 Tax=Ipomoea nil TaxID=35883 RepID=UPI00090194B7|nr:PREDICTED: U3 small nucleolar RNA-associated protein 18 homolog [Ipomoea nil]